MFGLNKSGTKLYSLTPPGTFSGETLNSANMYTEHWGWLSSPSREGFFSRIVSHLRNFYFNFALSLRSGPTEAKPSPHCHGTHYSAEPYWTHACAFINIIKKVTRSHFLVLRHRFVFKWVYLMFYLQIWGQGRTCDLRMSNSSLIERLRLKL